MSYISYVRGLDESCSMALKRLFNLERRHNNTTVIKIEKVLK